jgi:hypothetical protein
MDFKKLATLKTDEKEQLKEARKNYKGMHNGTKVNKTFQEPVPIEKNSKAWKKLDKRIKAWEVKQLGTKPGSMKK